MSVLSKHLFFQLSRLLLFSILLLGLTQELFALPLKTTILNPEKQVVGQALVYIDYVELLKLDGWASSIFRACSRCLWYEMTENRAWLEAQKIAGFMTEMEN